MMSEKTGRDHIPVAFGEMWYAGCIMQYLPSHPYAGAFDDPYDEVRFRKILDEEGGLGVYMVESDYQTLADSLKIDVSVLKPELHIFHYASPFGKAKDRYLYFTVIPPRNTLKSSSESAAESAAEPDAQQ